MEGAGAGRATVVAVCPGRQSTVLLIAQAVGVVAMLVVLALVAIAAVSVLLVGRAYARVVEDAKSAGHFVIDSAAKLAQSPFAAQVFAAGRAAQGDIQRAEQAAAGAAAAARKGGAAYSRTSDCYRWLAARQGERMRGELGPALALCPAGEAAVRDAQSGASAACPPEPGPPPHPQHEVYQVFLDAQCPWKRVWGALRPQGG